MDDEEETTSGETPSGVPVGLACLTSQCGHNGPSPVSPRYAAPLRSPARRLPKVLIELDAVHADPDAARWASAVRSD